MQIGNTMNYCHYSVVVVYNLQRESRVSSHVSRDLSHIYSLDRDVLITRCKCLEINTLSRSTHNMETKHQDTKSRNISVYLDFNPQGIKLYKYGSRKFKPVLFTTCFVAISRYLNCLRHVDLSF